MICPIIFLSRKFNGVKLSARTEVSETEGKKTGAIGFSTAEFNQIVVFSQKDDFEKIVAANPNMTAIIGADDYTRDALPGVFVAGVKNCANVQADAEKVLTAHLTPENLQGIGEGIADLLRQYNLHRSPGMCRVLFNYFSDVVDSWNAV